MNFTIKSRKTGEIFQFLRTRQGWLCSPESPDARSTGAQICRGEGLWGVHFSVTLLRTIWPVLPVNGTASS
jgi:hypothetical protein